MTLSELIEALENATGPSREIDLAIGFDVLGWRIVKHDAYTNWDSDWAETVNADGAPLKGNHAFTSSLDAAMDLAIAKLDDGAVDIEVAHRVVGGKPHGRAEICGPRVFGMAKSKTPAMALVLATLKALQARGDA